MESNVPEHGAGQESLDALRREVVRLQQRIAAIEQSSAPKQMMDSESSDSVVEDKLLAIISAALAAHLGVKPHIRQIRLIGGASWAQQGRVTIQASHMIHVRHGQE
jgi:methylmalonyl-CoA carboxyltransferase large subunit